MKALMLGISLITILASNAFAASNLVKLTSEQRSDIKNYMEGLGKTYGNLQSLLNSDGEQEEAPRFKYGGHKNDLMSLGTDLYVGGYLSYDQLKKLEAAIDQRANDQLCDPNPVSNPDGSQCGEALKVFWQAFYDSHVKFKEPSCKQEDKVSSAGACCSGTYKLPELEPLSSLSGKAQGESCQDHNECKSKLCEINEAGAGKCGQVYRCFKLIEENKECSPKRPYCAPSCDPSDATCDNKIECMEIDYMSTGVGECKSEGLSCASNADCCSDKCASGKCVQNMECIQCAKQGQLMGDGKCCPGLRESMDGRCIQDFPPFTLPGNVKTRQAPRSLLQKFLDIIIPSAHAREERLEREDLPSGGGSSEGESVGGGSANGGQCEVGPDQLTNSQRSAYENCLTENNVVGEGHNSEGSDEENVAAMAADICTQKKQEFIKTNQNNGCVETTFSRKEYRDLYNMPEIISKTYSDVKKCEFNSHNDSWRGKSYLARNAELALRGFEVIYSGKGGDMIVSGQKLESGKSQYFGKSIFERAQSISKKYRRNRRELVEGFRELDLEMTCKCLAVFGPSNFDSAKQEYFSESCSSEAGYVTEEGIRENRGDRQATEGDANKFTELDKGAVGISHEKLMVEWLGLRKEMQLRHFANNEELEEEMKDLSAFVTNYNWTETPGTKMVPTELHNFRLTYPASGFFRGLFTVLVFAALLGTGLVGAFIISSILGGGSGIAFNLSAPGGVTAAKYAMVAAMGGLFTGGSHDPMLVDKPGATDKCWSQIPCLKEYDEYTRVLRYPFFDNNEIAPSLSDSSNKCEINGTASNCVKSAYLVSQRYTDGGAITLDYQYSPLLDVTLPITVKENAYNHSEVKNGKTYAELLNESFLDDGIAAVTEKSKSQFSLKRGHLHRSKRSYNDHVRSQVLQDTAVLSRFTPENGSWVPGFFNDNKETFIKGVADYALCKNLNECAKHSKTLLGPNEEERDKAIGFGFLFEEENDAKLFAEYVYQMHLIWPRIGAKGRFGYPTLGMDAYFQTMYYNLMLAGSLALKQTLETQQMYDLYLADWEKRKGDYQGLGGAEQGTISSNVEIEEGVFKELSTLEFRDIASVKAYNSKIDGYEQSKKFGKTGLQALRGYANHALRTIEQNKRAEHYDKTAGATVRGKQKEKAAASFLENLNSPLKKMPLSVGGKNLGSEMLASAKPVAPKAQNEKMKKPKAPKFESASSRPTPSSHSPPAISSSYNFGGDTENLNSGVTDQEAHAMISSAEDDKSLEERFDNDTLWSVVSKAYKRNLGRVLVLRSDVRDLEVERETPAAEEISDEEKEQLHKLLENN